MAGNILVAWELGGGYGHFSRLLPIANQIAEAGHRVTLALKDVRATGGRGNPLGHRVIEAPVWRGPVPADLVAATYAELLLLSGFGSADVVRSLMAGWLAVFAENQPDLLLADFAPTAMLAARIAGLPVACIDSGWSLPPRTVPLPPLRPWDDVPAERMIEAEARVLGTINAALVSFGATPLAVLADLFAVRAAFLCTFAELDHYEQRGPADYYGPIYATDTGQPPEWPAGPGVRVFGYVNARHQPFPALIDALGRLNLPTVLHARNAGPAEARSGNIWFAPGPVRVAATLETCGLVICQGLGTISAALVAGRPLLLLPEHPEQMALLARVVRQGLGLGVPVEADTATIEATLHRLLDDPGFNHRSQQFAARYKGFRPDLPAQAIAEECCALLAG